MRIKKKSSSNNIKKLCRSIQLTIIFIIITCIYIYYKTIPEIIIYEGEETLSLIDNKKEDHIPLLKLNNLPIKNITINFWKECKGNNY